MLLDDLNKAILHHMSQPLLDLRLNDIRLFNPEPILRWLDHITIDALINGFILYIPVKLLFIAAGKFNKDWPDLANGFFILGFCMTLWQSIKLIIL